MNKAKIYIRFENQTDDDLAEFRAEIVPRRGDSVDWEDARHSVVDVLFQPMSGNVYSPVVVLAMKQ